MNVTTAQPRPVTPASILAQRLETLLRRAESLPDVDPLLRNGLREACELAAGLDPYLGRWSTPESPALRAIAERTAAHDWSAPGGEVFLEQEMLSGHVEGQLLKMLVHATRARQVLEIGMFTGYSALAMAEALPADGRVVACELDPGVAGFAREGFAGTADGHKIDVRVGPAQDTLAALASAGVTFDLVFLDADKAGYAAYLDALLELDLLTPHALVCVDNTLMQGEPWTSAAGSANGAAIAEFNRAVAADPRIEQVIVPLRDGITIIRRTARSSVHIVALEPIGVTVTGLPLADLTGESVLTLRWLLAEHGALILPGQHVDDDAFLAFLTRFGTPAFTAGETPVEGFPDLNVISNVGRTSPPRSVFHTDTSYVRNPPAYTALRAVRIPDRGGETLFTNQYRAYDTLPGEVRERLRGRTVRHVVSGIAGPDAGAETEADHPVFRTHPLSGRVALYLSTPERCVAISGVGDAEARDTIAFLYEHSTTEDNTLRHPWSAGDVVIWDNGVVLHRADHSGVSGDRVMHRGMVTT